MYVDDGELVDAADAKGEGQVVVHEVFELLGAELSTKKRIRLSPVGEFLGLEHSFQETETKDTVSFWPRQGLIDELLKILEEVRAACTPALASKFRGVQGFCTLGIFGQVGKAALAPFKQRQYVDVPPWTPSNSMLRAREYYLKLLEERPVRQVRLSEAARPPIVIASDAQVEPGRFPGGGYLLADPDSAGAGPARRGGWLEFQEPALVALGTSMQAIADGQQPIALCEAAMLPLALFHKGGALRGRDILWYVDNTAALSAMIKGSSGNQVLDRIVGLFWILTFRLQIRVWIEYVDSNSTWSDGVSREFAADPFAAKFGFQLRRMAPAIEWLRASPAELWAKSKTLVA